MKKYFYKNDLEGERIVSHFMDGEHHTVCGIATKYKMFTCLLDVDSSILDEDLGRECFCPDCLAYLAEHKDDCLCWIELMTNDCQTYELNFEGNYDQARMEIERRSNFKGMWVNKLEFTDCNGSHYFIQCEE